MQDIDRLKAELGDEPPLLANGQGGQPDKREISARWLSGTFLTGVTSSILLGVALFAALDGREQLATPPEIAELGQMAPRDTGAKAERVAPPPMLTGDRERRRMEVSTVVRSGNQELIRALPFVHVRATLAAAQASDRKYPDFDPLDVFAADGDEITATTGQIYGARVESDVTIAMADFPIATAQYDERIGLSTEEVEEVVRATAAILTDGDVQVAAMHYVDPQRFGTSMLGDNLPTPFSARIVPQNVSIALPHAGESASPVFFEKIVSVRRDSPIVEQLERAGIDESNATGMAEALATLLRSNTLEAGYNLRLGLERTGDEVRIVRASVYRGSDHRLTVALDDRRQFVRSSEPARTEAVAAALAETPQPVRARGEMPTAYDGIYRTAFNYGLSKEMTRHLIKLLAPDVDYKARLGATDQLELFFSQPDANGNATEESELLYVRISIGGRERTLYRFQTDDGKVDYFTPEGRSARQFLLRNPLPNGKFRSGFGLRRHPILKYSRMHSGVDWSAPRGTPIIAAGNGVVESAGWAAGYGNQVKIRHANGYVSSYSHQSAIAKGIVPGARVRQGQVIGYVGSTGLSTGPHLHYELIVNGTKVDPMRVRLPTGKVLKGEELARFQLERERIDRLLREEEDSALTVASR